MARRNDHTREELRALALAAAEDIISTQGLSGLSARKVAANIGYSAGSLYQVFRSIDDLCWQINERTLAQLLLVLQERAPLAARFRLAAYASDYLAFARQYPQKWALLFEHRSSGDQQVPEHLQNQITRLFQYVEKSLHELNPRHKAEEVEIAARALWSGVQGVTVLMMNNKLFVKQSAGEELMLSCLIDNFLCGWCGESKEQAAC